MTPLQLLEQHIRNQVPYLHTYHTEILSSKPRGNFEYLTIKVNPERTFGPQLDDYGQLAQLEIIRNTIVLKIINREESLAPPSHRHTYELTDPNSLTDLILDLKRDTHWVTFP